MQPMQKLNRTLLFLNLFFLQAYLIRFDISHYPSNLQELLIVFNCITFLISNKGLPNLKKHWLIWSFLGLTILSAMSTDIINFIDFSRHIRFLVFASALTYIFIETLHKKVDQEKGIQIASMGAIAFGLFSIAYNLLGYNVAYDLRLLGPLDAAVYLGFYFAPFFIYQSIKAFEQKSRSKAVISIALGALLIATRSMGAIAASFLAISAYVFSRSKKNTKIVLSIIGIIIAVSIFYTKILPTVNTSYSSLDERGEIWTTSAELLKEPKTILSGLGVGQFQEHYAQTVKETLQREPLDYFVLQPHNIFLLFQFQFGILGLALLILLIVLNFRSKNLYKYVLFYFLIHGLIDTPIFKNDILILFLLFSSLSLGQTLNLSKQPQGRKP